MASTAELSDVEVTQKEFAYLSNPSRYATDLLLHDVQKRGPIELAYKSIRILKAAAFLDLVRTGGEA